MTKYQNNDNDDRRQRRHSCQSHLSYSSEEDEDDDDYLANLRSSSSEQQQDDEEDEEVARAPSQDSSNQQQETIALFGADSPTGHHFLKLALDAGYQVRVLVPPGSTGNSDMLQGLGGLDDLLVTIEGSLGDVAQLQEVIYNASYIACFLGETSLSKGRKRYPPNCLQQFVQRLYPLLTRQQEQHDSTTPIKGFLLQATCLASDERGRTPLLSKVLQKLTTLPSASRKAYLQDVNLTIAYLQKQKRKVTWPYIVTRPSVVLRNGPSTKKLAASKSQPGPFPCSHVDLAEFSLNALQTKKLYNSCPYVVGDGVF